jgi:chemotaxis-related protein WspD
MTPLPTADCWNTIGVRGDRSCPKLVEVVHCHNCPVFAAAGRRFLDAPSPPGYLDERTALLAAPLEDATADHDSVLIFRVGDEWLALTVQVLVEVTAPKPVHRVPHRAGLLAGLVNIRGELHLCARLGKMLGINDDQSDKPAAAARMLLVHRDADRWVFPVDAVDQVHRVPRATIGRPPATVGRAAAHLSRGVFPWGGKAVGLLDDGRLFDTLRAKVR